MTGQGREMTTGGSARGVAATMGETAKMMKLVLRAGSRIARRAGAPMIATVVIASLAVSPVIAATPAVAVDCQITAPDEQTAVELAERCDLTVEVTGARTPWSTTSATPEGSMESVVTTVATRTSASGEWAPVDTRIVRDAGGGLRVAGPVYPMTLSDGAEAQPLVRLVKDGHELVFDTPFDLTEPEVEPGRVTYPGIAGEGVDLVVSVNDDGTGFSTAIRIDDAAAAKRAVKRLDLKNLVFPVTTSAGLTVTQAGDAGGFSVRDAFGKPVFVAPEPRMWDAGAVEAADPAAASSEAGVQAPLARAGVLAPEQEETGAAGPWRESGWEHLSEEDPADPDARLVAPLPGDHADGMAVKLVPAEPRHEIATESDGTAPTDGFGAAESEFDAGLTVGGQPVIGSSGDQPQLGGFGAGSSTEPSTVGLKVHPDLGMLSDPETTFPVVIDPSVTTAGNEWLMVHDPLTGMDPLEAREYMFDGTQGLGLCDVALVASCVEKPRFRLGWQFTGLDHLGLLDSAAISSATFSAYGDYSWDCDPHTVQLYRTGLMDADSTWGSWATTFTQELSRALVAHKPECDNAGWVDFDATAGVKHLADTDTGTLTLGLKALVESNMTSGWKRYRNDAKLTVEWTLPETDTRAEGAALAARDENREPAEDAAASAVPEPSVAPVEVTPTEAPDPAPDPDLVPAQVAPQAATAEVPVPEQLTPIDPSTLGGLEMAVGAPPAGEVGEPVVPAAEQVQIAVADQATADAAGVTGVLLDVTDSTPAAAGTDTRQVQVEVGYDQFADLAGADWSGRLQIVRIPACAETTPDADECQPVPVESVNDAEAGTITATLDLAASGTAALSEPALGAKETSAAQTEAEAAQTESTAVTTAAASSGDTFAVTAGASSSGGNWAATPLSAASSWSVSGGTGSLGWSYPVSVPAPAAGPSPELSIGYSSASLDGRVSGVNNQSSWIGDGWDMTSGFVERRYVPCSEDRDDDSAGRAPNNATRKTGDLCWDSDNAFLVFNGSSTPLVKHDDAATTGAIEWVPEGDDGTLVQQYNASARATEYWKVTTSDGTEYLFGKDERFAGDTLNQGSRWTVPVYGNHPGEPGHESSFRASSVQMGWRFMLDYVTDTSSNSMTYKYLTETNRYGANNNAGDGSGDAGTKAVQYTRGGTLDWVSYGTRKGSEPTAADGAGSPYLVDFAVGERCLKATGCVLADATKAQRTNWHDSPLDLRCTSTTSCKDVQFPAFFSTKRLTSVTSKVTAGGSLRPVNTWALTHSWRDPGDGTGRILWLGKIGRTAHGSWTDANDHITFDPVVFRGGEQLPGRVDDSSTDGYPAMNRIRLTGITTETGAEIGITYTNAACSHANSNGSISEAEQKANTQRCFPVRWHPWGEKNPRTEWFNSYMVQAITQSPGDAAVLGTQIKTSYAYGGGVAWGKVDDALVPKKDRTWSVLRGYDTVSVTTGTTTQTAKTTTRYLRGTGETLSVDSGITERTVEDHERFAGSPLVTTAYNGAGENAEPISKSITIPEQTETARTGSVADGDLLVATRATRSDSYSATYDAAGRLEHVTRQDSEFNAFGMVTQVDDFGAWSKDSADNDTSDDLCTRTTYLGPTTAGQVVVPRDTETVSVRCGTSPARPGDVVSAMRMAYDDKTYDVAPTKGLVTSITALDPDMGTFTTKSPVTKTAYDTRGRAISQTDALGRKSETAYTETAEVVTRVSSATPDPDGSGSLTAHVTMTTIDPLLGVPVEVTDPNLKKTTAQYDAAGRLTSVWYPDRAGKSASAKYAYKTTRRGVNTVTTDTLAADGSSYHRSTQIYDGLLRQIQTQSESVDGHASAVPGRVVVDTEYDAYGRIESVSSPWFAKGDPSTGLLAAKTVPPATTVYKYDGAGRATAEILFIGNTTNPDYEAWRTTTHYDGSRTTVVPPKGGVPTQTIVDARGRTTELRQYERSTTSGESRLEQILDLNYQGATYAYDKAGRLGTVKDGDGNAWSYEYDWLGRQRFASDPDSGKTETKYDDAGQTTSVTDAASNTIAYTYDALGRRTSARDGIATDAPVRAKWYYDAYHPQAGGPSGPVLKGQATASVRMVGTQEYVTALTSVDAAYRPTGSVTVIPAATGLTGLAGRYESSMTYTADGQVKSLTYGAAGNLRKETVTTMYNDASMPEWMSGGFGWGTYVATSRFDAYGRLGYMDLGNTYGTVVSYEYEDGTNRLTRLGLDRERIGGTELDLRYAYDPAGNVLSVKDVPNALGRAGDKQCFTYDSLRRLTQAWTPGTGDCGLARSIPGLGGAAPYWSSWEYDGLGNRTSETYRTPGQDGGLVTTTDYAYGGSRDLDGDGNTTDVGEFAGPHAVTGLEVTSNAATSAGTMRTSYTYDKAGRALTQTTSTDYERVARSLTWDRESELAGVSTVTTVWPEPEPGSGTDDGAGDPGGDPNAPDPDLGPGTTTTANLSNLYTADGDRLLRTAPDGSITLYVGGQEVTKSASGQVTAVRYYSFAGQTVAMRTAPGLGGVTSLVNDPHGTPVASVHNTNWTTTSVDKHYTLPFGGARGGAEMPGDRAFLGKTKDGATGLTLVGARWYDEAAGRFLSVDPIMDMAEPQQWNGYAYAGNSPLTKSDPTGLREFANDDPSDDTQEQIHSAVQHGLGNEVGGGGGSDAAVDDVVDNGWDPINFGKIIQAAGDTIVEQAWGALHGVGDAVNFMVGYASGCVTQHPVLTGDWSNALGYGTYCSNPQGAFAGKMGDDTVEGAKATYNELSTDIKEGNTNELIGAGAVYAAEAVVTRKIAVGKTAPAGSASASTVSASQIRFSQRSVNDGVAEIEASMRANGWAGDAIDVVRMRDGGLTSVDNRRVLAAKNAGIDVQALIHGFDDMIPEGQAARFVSRKGVVPETWGEAILNRIGNQGAGYRNAWPNGSPWTGWAGN